MGTRSRETCGKFHTQRIQTPLIYFLYNIICHNLSKKMCIILIEAVSCVKFTTCTSKCVKFTTCIPLAGVFTDLFHHKIIKLHFITEFDKNQCFVWNLPHAPLNVWNLSHVSLQGVPKCVSLILKFEIMN